jgi:hypothetical protein
MTQVRNIRILIATIKPLGITLPQPALARADDVIQ